jgi:hypothetical protein
LPASQILQIRFHRRRIFVPEVAGDLVDLASYAIRNSGDPFLIVGSQVFRGPAQGIRDRAELIGELTLALTQARARPIPGLLQAAAGLADHLILHPTNLFPGAAPRLLTRAFGSRPASFRVWHRHRVAPLC